MTEAKARPWNYTGGIIWHVAGAECCGNTVSNSFDTEPECCNNPTPSQEEIAKTDESNAALIVKAVNHHDALVEALEQVMGWIDYFNPEFADNPEWEEIEHHVRSILSQVKETPNEKAN